MTISVMLIPFIRYYIYRDYDEFDLILMIYIYRDYSVFVDLFYQE